MIRRWFFNLWYIFSRPPWDTGVSPPELMAFIESHSPGRALDVGCGTGTNVITLAQHGWQAVGVDFAASAIRTARKKARQAGVQAVFHVDDATQLKTVQGPFDLILDMGCFHGLSDAGMQAYARNIDRLLAPGGTFLLYVFFRSAPEAARPGVVERDLSVFSPPLKQVHREDGTNMGTRPSAWLTFEKDVA